MRNATNLRIYRAWAPVYDVAFDLAYRRGRRRAVALLALRAGERLLIPGVGTGLDLPTIPAGVAVTGIDLSPAMLRRARRRAGPGTRLVRMDAARLDLPDASVDAVLCNLVLSVVPDGAAAFAEAWRVLRPGGRLAILDKFLPPGASPTRRDRLVGAVASVLGTDVNRRLADVVGDRPDARVLADEPIAIRGRYRALLLEKARADGVPVGSASADGVAAGSAPAGVSPRPPGA